MKENIIVNLEENVVSLAEKFEEIERIYLFGSRRYNTGSSRSDIDLLLEVANQIKPTRLRDYVMENCTALDLFQLESGRAVSVANESSIRAEDNDVLIESLNAVKLYDKISGKTQIMAGYQKIEIDPFAEYEMTVFTSVKAEHFSPIAVKKYLIAASKNGLPAKPYLGITVDEASEYLIELLRRLESGSNTVRREGQANTGWTSNLKDEYDFQNLFWIVVKPWLRELTKEPPVYEYDGQVKHADFSLFKSKLIVELKFIKDEGAKREVVKTLEGLKEFYRNNANVQVLLFAIMVEPDVDLDEDKWEQDYSYEEETPKVRTIIIRKRKEKD